MLNDVTNKLGRNESDLHVHATSTTTSEQKANHTSGVDRSGVDRYDVSILPLLSMALAGEVPPIYQPPVLRTGARRDLETRAITFTISGLKRRGVRFRLAIQTLARTGIIVIRGADPPQTVKTLAQMADETWDTIAALPKGEVLQDTILNRDQDRMLRGYKALVESHKPVINLRHGDDEGMMDIFHPENLTTEHHHLVLECLHEDLAGELARKAFGRSLEVKCRNLYVNRGVNSTRLYHCDGEKAKVKSFVYLNDVSSFGIGPYCYIKKSHRDRPLREKNQAFNAQHNLNKHEYRLLGGRAALPIFCQAGDMVVSAQHGAHRGHPQTPSARRAVLLNVYEPTIGSKD